MPAFAFQPPPAVQPEAARPELAASLRGLTKAFGEGGSRTLVLKGASLEVRQGELFMLVGPSGCGKTTLLSILAGTLRADAGEVDVLGQPLHRLGEGARTAFRRTCIGFVFQQFNLIGTLPVVENVAVPLLIQGVPAAVARRRALETLDAVGIADKADLPPGKLSGGQQQRVAIARALVHAPPLIVCDEPTSALDRENGHLIMELLARFSRERTVIVVTHDPRTYVFADRMAEMEDGRIGRVLTSAEEIRRMHPPV